MDESRRHDDDLKAIQQLHEADKRATLALHVDALLDLWADDGVMLRPGSAPIVGKEAIKEVLRRWNPDPDQVEPLRADIDFQDVKIIGDWAIEYGTFDSAWHVSGEEAPVTSVGNILRVLKRQPDGSWKCARAIWNTNADAQQ
ncbi:MAG: SgcJ/EcaC family oxidoreductase [Phycisphaerales bacterium]|nr:MAG: SgcJ/EcaC family oxidoreductase [Phycisphaerales bacterium]